MSIVLLGSTSGSCTLQEQAVAGTSVLTLPVGTGTVVANNVNSAIVSGTAVASTSGTSIDFTGIPSWVKRVTVMLNQVSTNGSSRVVIRVGNSGGFITTGYAGSAAGNGTAITETAGILCEASDSAPAMVRVGFITLVNFNSNIWVASGSMGRSDGNNAYAIGGNITVSGFDRIRVTAVNGTDTFDAGSINILYE